MHISKLQQHLIEKHQMYYSNYVGTINTEELDTPEECQTKPKRSKKK